MDCTTVLGFVQSNSAVIVTSVLSCIVIIFNTIAVVSILRNYGRLRQRIYVFVVSLTAANLLVGLVFLVDATTIFVEEYTQRNTSFLLHIESFKNATVLLSSLNTALLTFVLYKRTTSMGCHHSDFRFGMPSDGSASVLPAFDTMMRVLSIGTTSVGVSPTLFHNQSNGQDKQSERNNNFRNSRKMRPNLSHGSKLSDHEPSVPSIEEESVHTPLNNLSTNHSTNHTSSPRSNVYKKKRPPPPSKGVNRLLNTGRRWSQAIRQRNNSTKSSQAYVGRHSTAVMTKTASICSILAVWWIFLAAWVTPIIVRQCFVNVGCSEECLQLKVMDIYKAVEKNLQFSSATNHTNISISNKEFPTIENTTEEYTENKTIYIDSVSEDYVPVPILADSNISTDKDILRVYSSPNLNQDLLKNLEITKKSKRIETYSICSGKNNNVLVQQTTGVMKTNSTPIGLPLRSACQSCSATYYPLNKITILVTTCILIVVWVLILASSLRLYWLRKHSTNVFVRCSALWRFILLTAAYYIVTLSPYISYNFMDYFMQSTTSVLQVVYQDQQKISIQQNRTFLIKNPIIQRFMESSFMSVFHSMSIAFLLIHCAIAPLLYLIRLLGFRRIVSFM